MGLDPVRPLALLDPHRLGVGSLCPPLGLIPADAWGLADLVALKERQALPVHIVFPVKDDGETANVAQLAAILAPLAGPLIDQGWLACGASDPGALAALPGKFPWLNLFPARRLAPPDQGSGPWGKGAVMRAMLHHLLQGGVIRDQRAIIQFFDADIRPAYFQPQWCLGPVGALLWFQEVAAVKTVYFRPRGGRLSTLLRSLLATIPHPGVQRLQEVLYLLSGEMAATMDFWSAVPFKTGYGVELLILLSLALDQVQLQPGRPDLAALAQVFVGRMDHRHAPLCSTRGQAGLDQMAATVFATLWEVLVQSGVLAWHSPTSAVGPLQIPVPGRRPSQPPQWLTVEVGEPTLPPLRTLADIGGVLGQEL